MRITCGTDIVEIDRIHKLIDEDNSNFINKIYTENEIKYCESKNLVKYQHYAARFAAKEAIFKAISDRLNNKFDISWKDIEVINDENGRPSVTISGINIEKIENIDISLSHCKEYAIANVTVLSI